MANEAVLRDTNVKTSRRYTCATGIAITKGALLFLYGDNTASQATAVRPANKAFLGIAHADVNTDTDSSYTNVTNVTADKGGVYDLVASGAIAYGQLVRAAGNNLVEACPTAITGVTSSYAVIIGVALETATTGERINVEVYP